MPDNDPSLDDVFDRIRFALQGQPDVTGKDPAVIVSTVRLLTAAATYFNTVAVADFGGRVGRARDDGLVEQVVAAAFQTFGGHDPHAEPFERAAMLLRGITQGHPFTDGNKRTGFLLASYYLDLAGYPLPDDLSEDDVVAFCLQVSAGDLRDISIIAGELRRLWRNR